MRAVAQGVETARDALASIDDKARDHLSRGRGHAGVGAQVAAHLDELTAYLEAASAERPITEAWVRAWNEQAQKLIARIIDAPAPLPPPPPPPPPPPRRLLHDEVVSLGNAAAIDDAVQVLRRGNAAAIREQVAKVKATLDGAGRGRVRVTITREDDPS